MRYINLTNRTVTVRGVVFGPNESKTVDGPINLPGFARLSPSSKAPQVKQRSGRNKSTNK